MHTLDHVGRLVPSTLEVSRAAAARHAHTAALEEPRRGAGGAADAVGSRDDAPRRHGWLRAVVVRLSAP